MEHRTLRCPRCGEYLNAEIAHPFGTDAGGPDPRFTIVRREVCTNEPSHGVVPDAEFGAS
jgi:hypothetical protein